MTEICLKSLQEKEKGKEKKRGGDINQDEQMTVIFGAGWQLVMWVHYTILSPVHMKRLLWHINGKKN